MADLAVAYPETNRGNGATVIPLKEQVVGNIRPILLMLFGAVGFVLLIACVNVSNLMLARSTGRSREFAIRSALAGRRQLLAKSLAAFYSDRPVALGLIVAGWGTARAGGLPTTLPCAEKLDSIAAYSFHIVISLLTGILAGLVPALKISRNQVTRH